MKEKLPKTPAIERRQPRQGRSLQKVDLVLEATVRLLDTGDIESLTTNAIAEKAGVSIGTLYQYFEGKQAILDALAQREVDGLIARVMAQMTTTPPPPVEQRTRALISAVLQTYGGRTRVHRLLIQYALTRGPGTRLNPLYTAIAGLIVELPKRPDSQARGEVSPADAFVLVHAVAGILRAFVSTPDPHVKRQDLEASLVRLLTRFLDIESG